MMNNLGRWPVSFGLMLVLVGREYLTVFIPFGTMLLVSLILTLLANLIACLWR